MSVARRHEWVQQAADELGIKLSFLPSYSPSLNLIERYWRLIEQEALYWRNYANFDAFRAGIERMMAELQNERKSKVELMMTLRFQIFANVPLLVESWI